MTTIASSNASAGDAITEISWRHVIAAQGGDAEALGALVREYETLVRDVVGAITRDPDAARDVAQDVWLKVADRLTQLRTPERFPAWLKAVARNCALGFLAARRKRDRNVVQFDQDALSQLPDRPAVSADRDLEARDVFGRLWLALGALSRRDRALLMLRVGMGLPYDEVGEFIGLSRSTAEVSVHRARRRVRDGYRARLPRHACDVQPLALGALLDDEPDDEPDDVEGRERLREHLAHCSECRGTFTVMRDGERLYRSLAGTL